MRTWQNKDSELYEGLPFMEIRGEGFTYPCRVEPKLDGEFSYVIKKEGKLYLANKPEHGRIRMEMPVLDEIEDKIPEKRNTAKKRFAPTFLSYSENNPKVNKFVNKCKKLM